MTTVTISLPESLKAFVETQVVSKGYGNVSEYFRSLLREALKREEEARLQALLAKGLSVDKETALSREFWTDLKTEAKQLARKHQGRRKA